jgi:antirestriction protein
MWPEGAPIVVYSTFTQVLVHAPDWAGLYASLQALKGHTQEYPGCQRFDVYFRAEPDAQVLIHCYTTWDTVGQLEAFLERGYTFERLIGDFGGEVELERSLVMEKIF